MPKDTSKPSPAPARQSELDFPIVKAPKKPAKTSAGTRSPAYTYDKKLMVQLVVKSCQPDWEAIASEIGKSSTKVKDLWRKVIFNNLVSGRAWCQPSEAWSKEEKMALVMHILTHGSIAWESVTKAFPGRTKTQVKDMWRKVVLPKIKLGEAVE